MVPTLEFPRAALAEIVGLVGGCQAYWDDEPEPFPKTKPGWVVKLKVLTSDGVGNDEFTRTYDAERQVNVTKQSGYRVYTVTIMVKSFNKDAPANDVIERIRFRLNGEKPRGLLNDVNMAIVDYERSVDLTGYADNRAITVSSCDMRFSYLVGENVLDNEANWIESVETFTNGLTP